MLSGYVIYLVLEKTRHPLDFLASRFTRLFPTYWFCLLLTYLVVVVAQLPHRQVPFTTMLWNLTMLQEFLGMKPVDGVYWTLACELAFYSFAFSLLFFRQLHRAEYLVVFFLAMVWGWAFFREPLALDISRKWQTFLLVHQAHFFGAGLMLYRLKHHGVSFPRLLLFLACFVTPVLTNPGQASNVATLGMAVFLLGVVGMLPFLRLKLFVFLGYISFPLYLVHQNIGYALIQKLTLSFGVNSNHAIVLTMASMIALATLISRYVEQPSMKWGRDYYASYLRPRLISEVSAPDLPLPVACVGNG